MKLHLLKNKYVIILIAFLLSLLFTYFAQVNFFEEIENQITDSKFCQFENPQEADSSVVLITIDDSSVKYLSENGLSYPWPRIYHAKVIDFLSAAGAKAILFDMQFYENDINRADISATDSDNSFAQSIANSDIVYLGSQLNSDHRFEFLDFQESLLTIEGDYTHDHVFSGFIPPIKVLRDSCHSFNPLNILPDTDGVFRRIPLFYNFNEKYIPQMPLKLVADIKNSSSVKIGKKDISFSDKKIPLDKDKNYVINWYKAEAFTNYPYKAIISSTLAILYGNNPLVSPSKFKDKIIIIGATAAGLMDDRTSPISKNLAGLEIWATIISNYLQDNYTYQINHFALFIMFFIISYIVLITLIRFSSKKKYFNLLLLIFIIGIDYFLWIKFRTSGALVLSLLIFLISFLLGILINIFLEEKSKAVLRHLFGKYISPDLIKILLENPSKVELGGKEITISVLFTDIYNFTDLSEKINPIDIIDNLNQYLHKLTNFVLTNKGYLDKFTGDGIMALYGTPVDNDNHAYWACSTAIQYKKFYDSFTEEDLKIQANQFHRKTRIAIHTGKAVAGNIGSSERMDYTAIGDTVNLSARLEAVNKIYQTQIIVSKKTYELVANEFLFRELDTIQVKGRKGSTTIYELIDFKCNKPEWIIQYENGLAEYRKSNWEIAASLFEQLVLDIDDNPSKEMLKRCRKLIADQPTDWQPVLKLFSK